MDRAIEVAGLVKRFDSSIAVAGIDLIVPSGQCVGLLGPNGAGKTTTVEILEGLQEASEGEVKVLGLSWKRDARELRRRIGVQLQETRFMDRGTVEETVELFASFHADPLETERALKLGNLIDKRQEWVMNLSGGQRQRLALAAALVGRPELVFLDEPSTGLDPGSRQEVWDVIRSLKREGRTVVLTTHYMEEAEALCDSISMLDQGKIIAQGTPAELVRQYGGDSTVCFKTQPQIDVAWFAQLPGVTAVEYQEQTAMLTVKDVAAVLTELLQMRARMGVALTELTTRQPTLNDAFLALTGRRLAKNDGLT